MTRSILKECVRLILSELQFDRAGYENAVASLMGRPTRKREEPKNTPEIRGSKEEIDTQQQRKTVTSDFAKEIFSQWEKSAGVKFDDRLTRDANSYLNRYLRKYSDEVKPPDIQSIINQLNSQFQDQINDLRSASAPKQAKPGSGREKLSEEALEHVTRRVLDELEKFYNDKKSLPKTRKFDDRSFTKDLQTYLKRELANKDAQKLSTGELEYLVRQVRYQFDRYLQNKVKASSK